MKNAANKMISPVYWTGLFISISGLIWLGIYYTVSPTEAMLIMGSVLACIALQTAAWLGGRKFPRAAFWPGLCMLAAGPATLWAAFAGPGALYGISAEILNFEEWGDLPPLYYVAIPVMLVGILVCIAFVITGLLSLSADLAGLGDKREQKRRRQRLMSMQPVAAASEAPGSDNKTKVIAKRSQRQELARATARQAAGDTPPDGATRYIPTEMEETEDAGALAGEVGRSPEEGVGVLTGEAARLPEEGADTPAGEAGPPPEAQADEVQPDKTQLEEDHIVETQLDESHTAETQSAEDAGPLSVTPAFLGDEAAEATAAERYQRGESLEEDAPGDLDPAGPAAGLAVDTEPSTPAKASTLPKHTIPVRPNVAPRWTPIRPARPRAGLVNPAARVQDGTPVDLFAPAPTARMQTRLESITQTLRLSAIRGEDMGEDTGDNNIDNI